MTCTKQYLKSQPLCKVTFHLSRTQLGDAKEEVIKEIAVLGDFNDWDQNATPMKKMKNGDYKATLNLPIDTDYQFRYLINGSQWTTDKDADAIVQSPISKSDNSLLRV